MISSLMIGRVVVGLMFVVFSESVTTAEYKALSDIYLDLNGPSWVDNTNWMTGDPCNKTWFGVSCTSGYVTDLALEKNLLNGTMPSSFVNLFDLHSLKLDLNLISGTIPSTIDSLRALGELDLSSNSFSGTIPEELGTLIDFSLQTVFLNSNSLSGLVPSFFADESDFTAVNLTDNLFVCPIPDGAAYTGATCINWTLSYTPTNCFNNPYSSSDISVYGSGFDSLEGVMCSFALFDIFIETEAHLVSSTHLYCSPPIMNFTGCTGSEGQRMVENGTLSLLYNGISISNSLQFTALNNHCPWKSSSSTYPLVNGTNIVTYSGSHANLLIQFPPIETALTACEAGTTNPYRCPSELQLTSSSPSYSYAVFDAYCEQTDSYSCAW
eukprot:CAMPEP_0201502574 /NCGR_PEP_ID=MMETSP0151_2-20130828/84206_1 /ASSEMBLY_ACC=CAM_ASM_000257 /TAXON_ID=200890 /ORGANISM="Paramoeba atlantica, Strain 621/1 / CCAP 1560/9" /LENGTH=381 /DNA_ID=CAMNT_0047896181 /DNA_START=998 /DNA_END=2140 /DNA_ORIENTATION=+